MIRKPMVKRLGRANPKKRLTRSPGPAEILLNGPSCVPKAWAERMAREAEATAAAEAESAARPLGGAESMSEPVETRPADPKPQTPPPNRPWWEEMCRWRPRGEAPPEHERYAVRYRTVNDYDPFERAEKEDDYDWDD